MSRHTRATAVVSHPPRFSAPLVSERLRLLDGVFGPANRAEHPVGHRPMVRAALLELLNQKAVLVHLSHSPVALGHCSSDERNPANCDVRVLTRRSHETEDGIQFLTGDLASGEGIEPAVEGVATTVHCAGRNYGDAYLTRNLVQAASLQTRLPHVVSMFGYFESKRETERVVDDSGPPLTTLSATHFHDLILTVARQMAKLPVIPLPAGSRFQPVEADEPAGLVPDMGGPRVYAASELLRVYLRATWRRQPVWLPGKAARVIRASGNLAPEQAVGHRSWEEFLAERVS